MPGYTSTKRKAHSPVMASKAKMKKKKPKKRMYR